MIESFPDLAHVLPACSISKRLTPTSNVDFYELEGVYSTKYSQFIDVLGIVVKFFAGTESSVNDYLSSKIIILDTVHVNVYFIMFEGKIKSNVASFTVRTDAGRQKKWAVYESRENNSHTFTRTHTKHTHARSFVSVFIVSSSVGS